MTRSQPLSLGRTGFWVLELTLFMIAYNIGVLQPIMPLIVRELNSSIGYFQGALVLFSLVTASFAPTTENLCRFYGRSPVFTIGLVAYGLGIFLTALSPDMGGLIFSFSLITGLAATPLISTPWAITDFVYDGPAEEQATLLLILASTLGGLSGSMLGGLIASQVGWRWAFLPSLAVFVLILLLLRHYRRSGRSLPEVAPPLPNRRQSIDWAGGLLSFLGLGSILLGIGLAGQYGWWTPRQLFAIAGLVIPPFALSIVPLLLAVGVICLGLFIFWQRRHQANQIETPLLQVGLLRKRAFVGGALTAMTHTLITTGVQFNLYQLLPNILALNPLQTAIAVLPYTLTMVVVLGMLLKYLALHQRLAPKIVIYLGLGFLGTGIGLLYQAIDQNVTVLRLMPGLMIMGMGSGLFLAYIAALTYSAATLAEKPEGSGIYNPIQNLGSSLGRGILGTILVLFTSQEIVTRVLQELGRELSQPERRATVQTLQVMIQTYSKAELRQAFARLPDAVQPALAEIVHTAVVDGMRASLLVALALTGVCCLLATVLPKYPRRRT